MHFNAFVKKALEKIYEMFGRGGKFVRVSSIVGWLLEHQKL